MGKTKRVPMSHTPRGTKYALDEEGYVKVAFHDSDGSLLDVKQATEMMARLTLSPTPVEPGKAAILDKEEPHFSDAIPNNYLKAADQNKLTKEMLLEMDYTDLLRLAAYKPASKKVAELIGTRGLPLRWGRDQDTNEVLEKPYRLDPHQIEAMTWMKIREGMDGSLVHGLRGRDCYSEDGSGKDIDRSFSRSFFSKGRFPYPDRCFEDCNGGVEVCRRGEVLWRRNKGSLPSQGLYEEGI